MKKFILLSLIALMFILSGCKVEQRTRVKQSQLLGEISTVEAVAKIEVASCSSGEDRSRPSSSLIKTNDLMKGLFPDSQFDGCENEGMESIATYIIPVGVGSFPPGENYTPKGVSVLRNQYGVVFYMLGKEVRDSVTKAKKDTMASNLALKINVRFTNDTDQEIKLSPHSTFVNGIPFAAPQYFKKSITIKPAGTVNFTLSDVSSEFALSTGGVPIYLENRNEAEAGK